MTDTRYLVHGVFWDGPPASRAGDASNAADASRDADDGGAPVLRLQSPEGDFRQLGLHAGARLGFEVVRPGKSCLGHVQVHSASSRSHVPCASGAQAVRGKQCERCFVLDESRLMHDFHRGGRSPPACAST
ncbi:hypothetical protein GCM10007170_12340 [Arthrobacter liuii]|uniref:Uncharacterized protein n=1 Tax=Arthrobacter liuii TaxID=1476996 RepID=A0ABQ2AK09_9MICC|nr:hypothetical protein GCM10007170_12340 [Arthrobacter liuii]